MASDKILKAKSGTNEIIVTITLNCLAQLFCTYLVSNATSHLIQMLPYASTLIALVIFGRNSLSPEGAGEAVE